jgi:hypothetical protein
MEIKNISGAFGNYPVGSIGAVLNSLLDDYDIPMRIVDSVRVGNGSIHYGNKLYGTYHWTDEGKMIFIREKTK